mmetsp:Transcript_43549/g.113293  ORF Transcript_43549/g.113293 Transcript_43549/m.113293 type:complete len:252 (+) Transcript_43549:1186-1941(+)
MVPDQDDVLRARVERREDVGLEDLRRLLDDDHLGAQLLQQLLVLGHGGGRHADDLHLPQECQLPVALQRGAVLRVALEAVADLGQELPRLVVGLQQPVAVDFAPRAEGQLPQVLLVTPVQILHLRVDPLAVLLPDGQPGVLQFEGEVGVPARLLLLLLLHVELPVGLFELRLLLFLVPVFYRLLALRIQVVIVLLVVQQLVRGGEATILLHVHGSVLGRVAVGVEEFLHDVVPQLLLDLSMVFRDGFRVDT